MTLTRDEIIAIIEDNVEVCDDYDLDMETGDTILVHRVDGIDKAADAIMARLEQDNKIALSRGTIELLDLLGIAL